MLTKILMVTAVICMALSIAVHAQVTSTTTQQNDADKAQNISPEKQALIRELIEVTGSKKISEEFLNTMFDQMQKTMPEIVWEGLSEITEITELSPAEQQRLREEITESAQRTSQRFRQLLMQRLDYAQMVGEISVSLYVKYFSEDELKDLIAFYKSTTGRHTLAIMPKLFAESMAKSQERVLPIIKDVMHEISSDEKMKFQKEIAAMVESHHRAAKPKSGTKRRQKP